MMRLFRWNPKSSSPAQSDKSDDEKEKKEQPKGVARSIDALTSHLSYKIHNMTSMGSDDTLEIPIDKISSEGRKSRFGRRFGSRFKDGSGSGSGSEENVNGSSSCSSQSSETQTFVSVESNDFGDHLNQIDNEFLSTNNMSIGLNIQGLNKYDKLGNQEKDIEGNVKAEEEPKQVPQGTSDPHTAHSTRFDKPDGPDNARRAGKSGNKAGHSHESGMHRSEDKRMQYNSKFKNDRTKFSPQKKKQNKSDYTQATYHYYQGQYAYPNYPQNYLNYHYPNPPNAAEFNLKESGFSTPNQYLDYTQYKDEYFHTSPNKNPDKTHTDGYSSKFYPYEPQNDHEYGSYSHNYHTYNANDPDGHKFDVSPKTGMEFKPENMHQYDPKTYAHLYKQPTVKPQIKPRQRAALQILNPDTGEVINSVKEDETKDKEKEAEDKSQDGESKLDKETEDQDKEKDKKEMKEDEGLENAYLESKEKGTDTVHEHDLSVEQDGRKEGYGQESREDDDHKMNGQTNHSHGMTMTTNKTVTSQRPMHPAVQMPVIQIPKTRLKVKNKPINPSEVIFTLNEMNPHKDVSPNLRDHSRSYQRKILNVPLTSCSNLSSNTDSSRSSDSLPEDGRDDHDPYRNLPYKSFKQPATTQNTDYRDNNITFAQKVKDFNSKFTDRSKEYRFGYDFQNRVKEVDGDSVEQMQVDRDNLDKKVDEQSEYPGKDKGFVYYREPRTREDEHKEDRDKLDNYLEKDKKSESSFDGDRLEKKYWKEDARSQSSFDRYSEYHDKDRLDNLDKKSDDQDKSSDGDQKEKKEMKEDYGFRQNLQHQTKKSTMSEEKKAAFYAELIESNSVFTIDALLQIALGHHQRYNEELGTFKLVPLNYSISTRRKPRRDNKWRSELSLEKEEITTCKLRKVNISKEEQYKRSIRTLLNKLTVENFLVVSEKIANLYKEATEQEQVETVVELLHEKATLELDYSDMYADLAFLLRYSFNDTLDVGSKTTSFHKTLLNKCQDSFEEISTNQDLNKDYILGNIRFMGELFLRKILSITILKRISYTLLTSKTTSSCSNSDQASENSEDLGHKSQESSEDKSQDSDGYELRTREDVDDKEHKRDEDQDKEKKELKEDEGVDEGRKEDVESSSSSSRSSGSDYQKSKTNADETKDKEKEAEDKSQDGESKLDKETEDQDKEKDKKEMKGDLMFEPPANLIECFSELLTTIGYTVDQIPGGSEMLDEYVGILITLKNSNVYPTRINFKIQDLIDLRRRNWKKKLFKEKATSVSQIHRQVEQEQLRGSLSQEGKYITAGLQTNRHYTQYLLNKRQYALDSMVNGVYVKSQSNEDNANAHNLMLTKREGEFGHQILKLFLTCPDHETFQNEWMKYSPTDVDVVNTFEHLLKSTLSNKTLELCLILAELIAFILTKLVNSEILRGKLLNMLCDSYVVRLHDELLDNPWAMIIVSKIMTMLFLYSTGDSRNLLEKISIPSDFTTSKKFVVNVVQGTRENGGDLGFVRRVMRRHLYSMFPQQNLLFLDEL